MSGATITASVSDAMRHDTTSAPHTVALHWAAKLMPASIFYKRSRKLGNHCTLYDAERCWYAESHNAEIT
jgi:hypothetical protein